MDPGGIGDQREEGPPLLLTRERIDQGRGNSSGAGDPPGVVENLQSEYWRSLQEEPEPVSPVEQIQVLGFRLGGEELALELASCRSILRIPALGRLPGDPPGLVGVYAFRGEIVPVLDLPGLLGLPPVRSGLRSRLVMLAYQGRQAAVPVDRVDEIRVVPRPHLEFPERSQLAPEVAGTGRFLSVPLLFEKVFACLQEGVAP